MPFTSQMPGEKAATVRESDLSFGIVVDLGNSAVGVLFQIYLFAGNRICDGSERIRIGDQGFKALMIDDFGKLAVGVVVFRTFRIAVKSIRIRLRRVYLQNISVSIRCGADEGRAVLRIVFGVYGRTAVYTGFRSRKSPNTSHSCDTSPSRANRSKASWSRNGRSVSVLVRRKAS